MIVAGGASMYSIPGVFHLRETRFAQSLAAAAREQKKSSAAVLADSGQPPQYRSIRQ